MTIENCIQGRISNQIRNFKIVNFLNYQSDIGLFITVHFILSDIHLNSYCCATNGDNSSCQTLLALRFQNTAFCQKYCLLVIDKLLIYKVCRFHTADCQKFSQLVIAALLMVILVFILNAFIKFVGSTLQSIRNTIIYIVALLIKIIIFLMDLVLPG